MKTPDKIYIQTNNGETLSSKWTTVPFRDFENTEYIRKDALLEWAEGEKEILLAETNGEDMDVGRHDMITRIIDKINSL